MPFYEIKPLPVQQQLRAKILEEVHPLHIIREVEKWPALYMRDCPERANAHFREEMWTEVAKKVMPQWDSYSDVQRDVKLLDLIRKWRNLRDTFKRHLELERKRKEGQNIKKRKYVYYNHMLFLVPHLSAAEEEEEETPPARPRRRAPTPDPAPTPAKEDIDEDHHFLMSLVPSFRRMTDDEKLTAKMEILKVIRNVREQSKYASDTLAGTSEPDVKQELFEVKDEVHFEDCDDLDAEESD